jgi:hypothetical protein
LRESDLLGDEIDICGFWQGRGGMGADAGVDTVAHTNTTFSQNRPHAAAPVREFNIGETVRRDFRDVKRAYALCSHHWAACPLMYLLG